MTHHQGNDRCNHCRDFTYRPSLPAGFEVWPCLTGRSTRCIRCQLTVRSCSLGSLSVKRLEAIGATPAQASSSRIDLRDLSQSKNQSLVALTARRHVVLVDDLATEGAQGMPRPNVPTTMSASAMSPSVTSHASSSGPTPTTLAIGAATTSTSQSMSSREATSAATAPSAPIPGPKDRLSDQIKLSAGDLLELANDYQAGQENIALRLESEIEVLSSLLRKMKGFVEKRD